ncbi:hypothetical protein [Devosia indica]
MGFSFFSREGKNKTKKKQRSWEHYTDRKRKKGKKGGAGDKNLMESVASVLYVLLCFSFAFFFLFSIMKKKKRMGREGFFDWEGGLRDWAHRVEKKEDSSFRGEKEKKKETGGVGVGVEVGAENGKGGGGKKNYEKQKKNEKTTLDCVRNMVCVRFIHFFFCLPFFLSFLKEKKEYPGCRSFFPLFFPLFSAFTLQEKQTHTHICRQRESQVFLSPMFMTVILFLFFFSPVEIFFRFFWGGGGERGIEKGFLLIKTSFSDSLCFFVFFASVWERDDVKKERKKTRD